MAPLVSPSCSSLSHPGKLQSGVALNLIHLNTSVKISIKTKRLLVATSDEFRAALPGLTVEVADDD